MVFAVATAAFTFSTMGIASAFTEGSFLEPAWIRVDAGEAIELNAQVSRAGDGWLEDGPFFAYLSSDSLAEGADTGTPVGELDIDTIGDSARVRLTVVIPENTPPGQYRVAVCNDPCTSGLGDLVGGVLFVGMDPPTTGDEPTDSPGVVAVMAPSPSTTTTTIALALAPRTSRPTGLSAVWVAISAGIGAVALAATALGRPLSK